jgi:hypothetical protein
MSKRSSVAQDNAQKDVVRDLRVLRPDFEFGEHDDHFCAADGWIALRKKPVGVFMHAYEIKPVNKKYCNVVVNQRKLIDLIGYVSHAEYQGARVIAYIVGYNREKIFIVNVRDIALGDLRIMKDFTKPWETCNDTEPVVTVSITDKKMREYDRPEVTNAGSPLSAPKATSRNNAYPLPKGAGVESDRLFSGANL